MDYKEAYNNIFNSKSGSYSVTTTDGTKSMRLFISTEGDICRFAPRSRRRGYSVPLSEIESWIDIQKQERGKSSTNIVEKFKKYASRASFTSPFIRKCLSADPDKDCYENGLTTGTRIDGEIISLKAVERYAPYNVAEFRKALAERRSYRSGTFSFRGYDGSLWIEVADKDTSYLKKGDVSAGLSKEYRGCGNGYYYMLIDDEHFIGTDID